MFKFNKKTLIYFTASIFFLLLLSGSILAIRSFSLNVTRAPLSLSALLKREINGIIFYHRNLAQNEMLKRQVDLLKQKINSLNEIYLENLRLKKLLSFKQTSSYKVIAAKVIARSSEVWSSAVIIDKGSIHGIRKGMAAISYLGLIGRVTQVAESASTVMLISDPSVSISGLVQRSRQEGLVSGTLGANLMMRYLPENADIRVQDIVVTSGLNQVYPKGILIGTVVDIGNEFSGLSRYALIKPAVNLSDVEEILIVIP